MADKKYYWLKLPTDFFAKPSTIMLMGKGDDKISVYIQMLTMAVNTNCKLMYTVDTPYTVNTLSMLLRRPIENVKDIIDTLTELKLLKVLEDGTYYLTELPDMIGSETSSAKRQRDSRQKRDNDVTDESNECDSSVTSCDKNAQCHIEKENRERDRDRDLKDIYSRASTTTHTEPEDITEAKGEPRPEKAEKANKPKKAKESKADTEAVEVIEYLNTRTGSAYRTTTSANIKPIRARLNDGFTVDDCKKVIDTKANQWLSDTDMSKYLRPETLFRPSKFETYLNECRGKPNIRGDSAPISDNSAFYQSISASIQRQMNEPVGHITTNEELDALGIK